MTEDMTPDGGFTRSYRRKWDNPVFANRQQAAVWAWMCDVAQWQDTRIGSKYGPLELRRGELVIAERSLAEDFGLHRNTLRALLNRMVDAGMISLARDRIPHRAGTIVHITKYEQYQGSMAQETAPAQAVPSTTGTEGGTAKGPQKDQEQVSKQTEDSKGGDSGSVESHSARTHETSPVPSNVIPMNPARAPIPHGWVCPEDWVQRAVDMGHPDVEGAIRRFAMNFSEKPTVVKTMGEWGLRFIDWIDKDIKREKAHGQQRHAVSGHKLSSEEALELAIKLASASCERR